MPTELLYRETIYCKEWYNAQTNDWFRLFIIPERKIGNKFTPSGGFKLKEIPNTILKNVADIERNVGELKIGMMDTPTLQIELNAFWMPAELQYIIVNLENTTMTDDKYYTNTWILQSDRNSNRTKWFSEFVGIQRKTPGIKSKISRLNADGIPINSEIHIVLFNIGRAVLENVKMFDAVKKTKDTSGLGELSSSGILTSYPYKLKGSANIVYLHDFADSPDYPSANYYQLTQEPTTGYLECYPLSLLFYWIIYYQQLLCRSYMRSNSVNINYNNANGDRRFPHDNIKFRNNKGTSYLNADQIYMIGYLSSKSDQGEIIAGGYLEYSEYYKDKTLSKYQNVYDFYKDISENFASALVYYDNLNIDIETMPSGASIIELTTLPCIGSLKYNFSRIKENINTTDDISSDFDITSAERNIDYSQAINDSIELEQGSTLIRSVEANIDTQFKRNDDIDKFVEETTSILSERKFEAKCIFDTHLHIPDVFKIKTTLRDYGDSSFYDFLIKDQSIYAVSNLYYLDGTETIGTEVKDKIYKVHTAVDFLVDNIDNALTYDNISDINTRTNNILKGFIYFLPSLTNLIHYADDGSNQTAKMLRLMFWYSLQINYGLAASLCKYLLNSFSKPNQSSIELSFDSSIKIYNNWVGDYFNLSFWDLINSNMDFISTKACLLSFKQNRFTGKTDIKLLTEGS